MENDFWFCLHRPRGYLPEGAELVGSELVRRNLTGRACWREIPTETRRYDGYPELAAKQNALISDCTSDKLGDGHCEEYTPRLRYGCQPGQSELRSFQAALQGKEKMSGVCIDLSSPYRNLIADPCMGRNPTLTLSANIRRNVFARA